MSRPGPRLKRMRALGLNLPGLSRKSIEKRPYPPGQHGPRKAGRRISDFGRQLLEKQKLRLNYGLNESDLRRAVLEARRSTLSTGAKLVELLERRLDNVVFRAGLAPSIPAARQLVRHRHISVNDRVVTIPSLRVRAGDIISARERSREHPVILDALQNPALTRPDWLAVDPERRVATVKALPDQGAPPFPVDLQRVVEYYATRI